MESGSSVRVMCGVSWGDRTRWSGVSGVVVTCGVLQTG